MRYFVLQLRKDDCGFASFKMVLATLSHSRKALYLANPKREGNYTFFALQQYAQPFGITFVGYQTGDPSSFLCPFIALMKKEQSFHYLVVDKITMHHVYYRDPAFGKKKVRKKEFFSFFSGYILAIQNYEKKKINDSISFFSIQYLFIVIYIFFSLLLFFFLPSEVAFLLSFLSFFLYEQIGKERLEHRLIKQIPRYFTHGNETREDYQMYLDRVRQYEEYPFALVQMIGGLYLLFLYGRYTGISLWQFLLSILVGLFLTFVDRLARRKEPQLEAIENSLFQGARKENDIKVYQKKVANHLQKKKFFHFIAYLLLFFLCVMGHHAENHISLSLLIAQFIFFRLFVETCYRFLNLVLQHEKRIAAYLYIKSFYHAEQREDLPSS